jgi:nucleoside-diphosphate-sugar epimerase
MTGAGGKLGTALCGALRDDYRVIGLDLVDAGAADDSFHFDITSDDSVELALRKVRAAAGDRLAAVLHLAAYFDFTGEDSPLYREVNLKGTRRLLGALQDFGVERFIYSSTMLVHEPGDLGQRIDESAPIAPKWAYPQSKAATERVIEEARGSIPYLLLRLAGLYDEGTAVPTLSHQIARIYERTLKSRLYAGDIRAGQAFLHMDDAVAAIRAAIDRRADLPEGDAILVGEPEAMSYAELQDRVGQLIHGTDHWTTMQVPKPLAKAGAWLQSYGEPVVPDAIDRGEKPFIRPFMVDMAEDHYDLNIERARERLSWKPKHRLRDELPRLIDALRKDPAGWYHANGITPPAALEVAAAQRANPERLRARHEAEYRAQHRQNRWASFLNIGLGTWLVTSPPLLDIAPVEYAWSDVGAGMAVMLLAALSLSWRFGWARWAAAAVGVWVMFAPLAFWTPTAAAYVSDTLVGMLIVGFAVLTRPTPGVSYMAARSGPDVPPGWDVNPSSWTQRLPIIALAVVGLYVSRYLAAYQLGHVDSVWEPFFGGTVAGRNGTEQIITSRVSAAWPVSDAGLGGLTYALEILTGIIGSTQRWRTMPWVVVLFGIMIVPLGVVSITFIVIQPIVIGTWCTLCLIAAAAMLLQIPYSLDELVATGQFLWRRKRKGQSLLRVFFVGDTDDGKTGPVADEFDRGPWRIITDTVGRSLGLPWSLALSLAIGVWLMFTRLTLGSSGGMANADHLIGSLVITMTVAAMSEVARPLRFLNIGFGIALLVTPFAYGVGPLATAASLVCGVALIGLSAPRGRIDCNYGEWNRMIV